MRGRLSMRDSDARFFAEEAQADGGFEAAGPHAAAMAIRRRSMHGMPVAIVAAAGRISRASISSGYRDTQHGREITGQPRWVEYLAFRPRHIALQEAAIPLGAAPHRCSPLPMRRISSATVGQVITPKSRRDFAIRRASRRCANDVTSASQLADDGIGCLRGAELGKRYHLILQYHIFFGRLPPGRHQCHFSISRLARHASRTRVDGRSRSVEPAMQKCTRSRARPAF